MILLIYLKQIRKDYFTDKYVFINSNNFDFSFNRSNPSITSNICVICNKSKHNIIFQPDSLEKILSPQSNSTISKFDIDNKSHQEILIADEIHKPFSQLTIDKLSLLLNTVQTTFKTLISANFKNIVIYSNSRFADDYSHHANFEILTIQLTPPSIFQEIESSKRSIFDLGICPMCRIINLETGGPRQILSTSHFLAFSPWAPTYPFEFWIYPKLHQSSFASIAENEIHDLSLILRSTLGGLDSALNEPFFHLIFHNSVNDSDGEIHWHIEIYPQLKYNDGLEEGFDMYSNPINSERSAEILGKAARKELAHLVGVT